MTDSSAFESGKEDGGSTVGALLPCPFCGGEAEVIRRDVEPQGDPWYRKNMCTYVACRGCGCCLFDCYFHETFPDAESAIKYWNMRALRAALTAETARADGLAHEKPQWIAHLADAQDRVDALQSQLTAANEKMARAREAIGNLRDALRGFARIEVPADAPNSQWVAKTLHCNDQVTAGQVLRARTVLLETTLSEAATSPTTPASQEGQRERVAVLDELEAENAYSQTMDPAFTAKESQS